MSIAFNLGLRGGLGFKGFQIASEIGTSLAQGLGRGEGSAPKP